MFSISKQRLFSILALVAILVTTLFSATPVFAKDDSATKRPGRIYVWERERNGGRVELKEQLYLVKGGDNLTRIAKSYGLTLEKLLAANPQIDDSNKLLRGELVYIPAGRAEKVPPFYSTPHIPSK